MYQKMLSMMRMAAMLALWACSFSAHAELNVVYPSINERPDNSYGYRVLELALSKSGKPYKLSISPVKMNQERARKSIEDGMISILDAGTSEEFESRFRAIYFPIDRGLSGYRLFIISQAQAKDFSGIKDLAGLTGKVAGQGFGWSDVKILEKAGVKVQTADFDALFRMVEKRRIDFFPLGVEEIYGWFDKYKAELPTSMVEEKVVLHYPFARLFFVKKNNTELHDAVLAGLQRAFEDGSFQALLWSDDAFKKSLNRSDLNNRSVIEIENPNLTPKFLEIPARYFYRPRGALQGNSM